MKPFSKCVFAMLEPSDIINCLRMRRNWLTLMILIVFTVVLIFLFNQHVSTSSIFYMLSNASSSVPRSRSHSGYDIWPPYAQRLMSHRTFHENCIPSSESFSIATIAAMVTKWSQVKNPACRQLLKIFTNIYSVELREGTVNIPPTFVQKVKGWLGNKEELYGELFHQNIIHVSNLYTRETTVFNPLRDKRPVTKPKESEEDYLKRITIESAKTCDFCRFRDFTAEHIFGRVESNMSFSASNIFKLDSLHAVITMKEHDPINWSFDQYMDMMKLTMVWLNKANTHDASAAYPAIIWDLLPKSGSSQLHPHNQVFLSPNRYQGMVETWRLAAQDYFSTTRSNYFTDLVSLYSALDLVAQYKSAVAMASLTPRKDNEVVIIGEEANEDFFRLIYYVLRAFMDDLKKYSFSLGGGLPSMGKEHHKGKIPAFVRIITRGVTTEIRTDISALELFTATNVNIDPYKVIGVIRESIQKRVPASQNKS